MLKQLLFLTFFIFSQLALVIPTYACCMEDPVTITELLVSTTDARAILEVTIDTSWVDQRQNFRAIAVIDVAYKNRPKGDTIIICSGAGNSSAGGAFLQKGKKYLLVNGTRDGKTFGGFVCDKFSRALENPYGPPRRKIDNLTIIRNYFQKVKSGYTGKVVISHEDKILMEGYLENGIPKGLFKHYKTPTYGKLKGQHLLKSEATYVDGVIDGTSFNTLRDNRGGFQERFLYNMGQLKKMERWFIDSAVPFLVYLKTIDELGPFQLQYQKSLNGRDTLASEYSRLYLIASQNYWKSPDFLQNIFHGRNKRYYRSGVLKEEGEYFWGAKIGYWLYYAEDGSIDSEEYFSTPERPPGLITVYHPNGSPKAQGHVKDRRIVGNWKFYNDQGKLKYSLDYINGLSNGSIVQISEDWHCELEIINGKKNGFCKYYKNGKVSAIERYLNGESHGAFEGFVDGKLRKIAHFKNGIRDGFKARFSETGDTLSFQNYTDGYLDGPYRDIQRSRTEEGIYKMGWRVGLWKTTFKKLGYIQLYDYKNGIGMSIHQQDRIREDFFYSDLEGNGITYDEMMLLRKQRK